MWKKTLAIYISDPACIYYVLTNPVKDHQEKADSSIKNEWIIKTGLYERGYPHGQIIVSYRGDKN